MLRRAPATVIVALILSACDGGSSGTTGPDSDAITLDQIGIQCKLGCLDEDPFPNSPGEFVGSGATAPECFGGSQTDRDVDGVGDYCEQKLAYAFRPELAYYRYDAGMGREPRWAARRLGGWTVRIAYLPAYYIDGGVDDPLCQQNVTPASWCEGHYGDSELIALDVQYPEETDHWLLTRAHYSKHGSFNVYETFGTYPKQLLYPGRVGGYPRSYVAINKHANYASESACDKGQLGFDECTPNSFARLRANGSDNIGSRPSPLIDCIASENQFYADNGFTECFWTWKRFRGWQGAQPDAGAYSDHLATLGF